MTSTLGLLHRVEFAVEPVGVEGVDELGATARWVLPTPPGAQEHDIAAFGEIACARQLLDRLSCRRLPILPLMVRQAKLARSSR